MRRILKRIEERQADYVQAPFFAFLRDSSIDVRRRLAFAPHVTHFVLTFADLCTLVLPREPPRDRYQELVNANCLEDRGHWRWFLSDLEELGTDPVARFSDAVKLIWSDATVRTRKLSYHLVQLGGAEDSLGRLVLVHCIEGAFKMTVTSLGPVAREFIESSGRRLDYLGVQHAQAEQSHTLEDPAVRRAMEEIQLTPPEAARLCALVDDSFAFFRAFADEMQDLAQAGGRVG
jgi:hypothetical protein